MSPKGYWGLGILKLLTVGECVLDYGVVGSVVDKDLNLQAGGEGVLVWVDCG